jgi:N-methylhydantoinase A
VLSALGLAIAPQRRVATASVMNTLAQLDEFEVLRPALTAIWASSDAASGGRRDAKHFARARYAGQGHELDVELAPALGVQALRDRFATRHHERFGFTLERDVEIVSVRGTISTGGRDVALARRGKSMWSPDVRIDDGGVMDGILAGRSSINLPDATLLVADGWVATALPIGGWQVERRG